MPTFRCSRRIFERCSLSESTHRHPCEIFLIALLVQVGQKEAKRLSLGISVNRYYVPHQNLRRNHMKTRNIFSRVDLDTESRARQPNQFILQGLTMLRSQLIGLCVCASLASKMELTWAEKSASHKKFHENKTAHTENMYC